MRSAWRDIVDGAASGFETLARWFDLPEAMALIPAASYMALVVAIVTGRV